MKWAHFLHIYQPYDQHPGILDKIVNESYRPLIRGLYNTPNGKLTLNVNAVLSELLFANGFRDVIDSIKDLVEMGRLELTGSAKYHAFLPLLPDEELKRQIVLNHETNKRYFGSAFNPKGFFPPEMAYSPKIASFVKSLGYEWILIDEVAMGEKEENRKKDVIYEIQDIGLKAYFREKHASNIIMAALVRTPESLEKAMGDRKSKDEYVITAMDGETFGHHRPGLDLALFDILKNPDYPSVFISDLPKFYTNTRQIVPIDSTWATSIKDSKKGNPFNLWFDNDNIVHKHEWELLDLAVRVVNQSDYSDEKYPQLLEEVKNWNDMTEDEKVGEERKRQWIKCRDRLDKALNSDPFWWASAKPWWSIEMIEKGMFALYKLIQETPNVSEEFASKAEELYKKILFIAHDWQRTGKVDQMAKTEAEERKIPLSKRFGATAYYQSLLDALAIEEKAVASRREYEQAIKWRDARYKLEKDLDIYDAVHIIDQFRNDGNFDKFQEILKEYKEKYNFLSKGQPS